MMRSILGRSAGRASAFACVLALAVGCEWGGGESRNTARGAGAQINFSGVYRGNGGALVAGSPVSQLTISQVGDTIEVTDNNGSVYRGRVGSPGVVGAPDVTGNFGRGATMLLSQIGFTGRNVASGAEVRFSGIIRVVSVAEVRGVTSETRDERTVATDVTTTVNLGIGTAVTRDTTLRRNADGTTYSFRLTESNSNFILEGNWNEGRVKPVNGIARAATGIFSVVTASGAGDEAAGAAGDTAPGATPPATR